MTSRNKSEAGFTLLELLVVIVVMSLTMALLTLYGKPHSHWLATQAAAREVAQAMAQARGRALLQGEPAALALPKLPAWLTVTVQAPPGGILFLPDGSASFGQVALSSGGQTIEVEVDWLTGRAQIHAP